MRARRGLVVGWVVVAVYAALLVLAGLDGAADQDRIDRDGGPEAAAERFVGAWQRSREGTFVASGTFERRSEVTGARIGSEDVVAQRPPRRIHRQLGGIDGRDDDRMLLCPAAPSGEGEAPPCRLGEAGGRTYAESVRSEVAGVRSLVEGPQPVYSVRVDEGGCFELEQQRVEPRAPFGVRAHFCFDPATGAPSATRVEYEGGITEVLVVAEIRAEVRDVDLEP